ncbi:aminopeptidase N-like [Haematobia irritans]|uniref:aminopeptidase N-like n=1 Tax=Haematobia irritans TaxID=7368 RepID=UPI003F4FE3B1
MLSFRKFTLVAIAGLFAILGSVQSSTHPLPIHFQEISEQPTPRDDLNYRLPNHTIPQHYDIVLTTRVDEGIREFNGVVTIDLTVVEATTSIILNARQLNFTAASIQNSAGQSEELTIAYEEQREFLTLTRQISDSFPANTKWKLSVSYSGLLRSDNAGFYLTTYQDTEGNERYLAATQFESTNARHAFPCYDDPGKRATFTVTINHSPTYTAISNMPVNEEATISGKTVFQQTQYNMSTYLVAFIISDFKYSEGTLNGLTQRVYSRPGSENEQEWGLVSGMLITQRLAEYYGVDFMLPKLDQAAIPNKGGAMENWGMATYGEHYMLYNKDTSTIYTQTNIANIIGHELCHQWFGDYVTIEWWTYLWLKEGFASLFSYKATDDAYPEWGIWQQFHTDAYQDALVNDGDSNPIPMTHYVQTPAEISSRYNHVSYEKAGSVLHMWNHALTDRVFKRGLQDYLENNKFSAAVEDDLFTALQTAAKEENYVLPAPISDMLGSWSHNGGYPMLTVIRDYEKGTFEVHQQAFFNNETITSNKLWYVPFNHAVQSKPDFRDTEATHYLMKVSNMTVPVRVANDEWLILNKQSTGFYRINYDEQNWKLLIRGLVEKPYQIHPRNRAQLMHDAYRFSASQRLSHSILMEMLTYLSQEDQYAPWSTANGIFNVYNRYLSGDSNYGHFKEFVASIVYPIYEKMGINDNRGEHHYQKYIRNIIINLACMSDEGLCWQETNAKLQESIDHNTAIEPNLQSQIYCNGLKQASDEVFQYMFTKLMETMDQTDRNNLIASLGCAQSPMHLDTFISSSIDRENKLRSQERTTILSSVYSRGEKGLYASMEFLDSHWQAYAQLSPDNGSNNPLDIALRDMASYVVNKDQEMKLMNLIAKVKDSSYVSGNLEEAVKSSVQANFDWLSVHRDPIMTWLGEYRSGSAATATVPFISLIAAVLLTVYRIF